jgi:3-phytase
MNGRLPISSALVLTLSTSTLAAAPAADAPAKPAGAVRFATFNASLNRGSQGQLVRDLSTPDNEQARNVAEIIQRCRPDVLLVNEFDYDPDGRAADLFQKNYLGVGQRGAEPVVYPHRYTAEVNTGVPSGHDLDNDGKAVTTPGAPGYGNDAIGFGQFPGQYGMVIYSMFPIDREHVRRFDRLLWKDMPGALLPKKPDGSPWYSPGELAVLRLSSKGHWDVPVRVGGKVVHVLASHPTPPAFDGPERRNANRNHDEIRLWADYLSGGDRAAYLRSASPSGTPVDPPETFLVMGDLNADPADGGGVRGAIDQLLSHPKVNAAAPPRSAGAAEAAKAQGGANDAQRGDPALDTADFADGSVGNLRADYILPSRDLAVLGGGVFWPAAGDPLARLVGMEPVASSDHRLVYLDVRRP